MSTAPTWPEVVLVALNVGQTIALAYMSTRSRRVRTTDSTAAEDGRHEA